jgi:hypothetical protein
MEQLPVGTKIKGETNILEIKKYHECGAYDIATESGENIMFIEDVALWGTIKSGKWSIIEKTSHS